MATLAGAALGTTWRVRFVAGQEASLDRLRALIDARLATIVAEMSQWAPDSVLSRFNRAPPGSWTALPSDFATVVDCALDIAARSGGAFDPTHGRAAALLGFGAAAVTRPPTVAELDDAHADAGWRRLDYDPHARRLRQPGGLWLDLSGIAKGFAVDALADLLCAAGYPDALIEIGGELVGRGLKPDGHPWWVDVEAPPGATLLSLRVALHEQALATSGDYVRGAHTIDPTTGRPLGPRIASVSVLHDSAMLADAWATALTALGPEQALSVATREGIAARMVARADATFIETLSPKLRNLLAIGTDR